MSMTSSFWLNLFPFPVIHIPYIDYKTQILQKIYDCVSTQVSFLYCLNQNKDIVQMYYHSGVGFSHKLDGNLH